MVRPLGKRPTARRSGMWTRAWVTSPEAITLKRRAMLLSDAGVLLKGDVVDGNVAAVMRPS